MENGLKPPLNASLILLAQVAEGFVLLGMLPFTRHPGRVVGIVAAVLPFIGLALLLGTISIAVFGMTELRKLLMPALELSRIIDIPGLPRSDVLIMAGWYGGIFVKLSVLHYFLVLLCAQYTGLRTYKPLIIPVGIIMLSLSSVIFPNTTDMLNFISGPYTYFLLTFEFVLPLIMLIVSFLRGIEEKEGVH
jgi:spore germination protein KB